MQMAIINPTVIVTATSCELRSCRRFEVLHRVRMFRRPTEQRATSMGLSRQRVGRQDIDVPAKPDRARRSRNGSLGILATLSLLLTGCAAAHAQDAAAEAGASMKAGMSMPVAASVPAAESSDVGPSQSARMVCAPEIRRDVATTLGTSTQPSAFATWSQHLYTCTYHWSAGNLILAVKELSDVPTARRYFEGLRLRIGPTKSIQGLASLGLPGYETTNGIVVFLKDDKTLLVDATALPELVGSNLVPRTDFAYQIATDVLGCWTGK